MASSDLSTIESEVIREALRETVEDFLKTKDCEIHVSSASQAGANNFIGIVYRASFCKKGGNENGTHENGINGVCPSKLILKAAPQSAARREKFTPRIPFLQEIYMYNEVKFKFGCFDHNKTLTIL